MQPKRIRTTLFMITVFLAQMILPTHAAVATTNTPASSRRERVDLRDANRRVFETPDGLEYEIYVKPIHEKDENGQWVNRKAPGFRKVRGESTYALDGLPFSAELSGDDPQDPKLTVERNGRRVSFGLGDVIGKKGNIARVKEGTLFLEGVDGASELQYQLSTSGLKETLVLKEPTQQNAFRFPVTIESDISFTPQVDGSLIATDSEGEVLWRILPATAEDKAGAKPPFITQAVVEEGDQRFVEVTVDAEWITSSERVWPVLIDPTVIVEPDVADGMDTEIYRHYSYTYRTTTGCATITSSGMGGLPTSDTMKVRYPTTRTSCNDMGLEEVDYDTDSTRHSLIKFDLHGLPVGVEIQNAQLQLYSLEGVDGSLDVRLPTQEWLESTASWTFPWGSGGDFGPPVTSFNVRKTAGWVEVGLKEQVRDWLSGARPNWGIALSAPNATAGAATFVTSDSTDLSRVPHLIVRYAPDRTAPSVSLDLTSRLITIVEGQDTVIDRVEVSLGNTVVGEARNLPLPPPTLNPETNLVEPSPLTLSLPVLSGVAPGDHSLRVSAWDKAGNEGLVSTIVTLTAPPPLNLQAVSLGQNRVQLTWTPSIESGGTYRLYRSTTLDRMTATPLRQVDLGTSVIDTVPDPGTYYYWVTALTTSGGDGDLSEPAAVAVQTEPGIQIGFVGSSLREGPKPAVYEFESGSSTGKVPAPQELAWRQRADRFEALGTEDGQVLKTTLGGSGTVPYHLIEFPVLATVNRWRQNQGLAALSLSELSVIMRGLEVTWTGNASGTGSGAKLLAWEPATSKYVNRASTSTYSTSTGTQTLLASIPLTYMDFQGRIYLLVQGQVTSTPANSRFATDLATLSVSLTNQTPEFVTAAPAGNGTVQVLWPAVSLGVDLYRSTQPTWEMEKADLLLSQATQGSYLDESHELSSGGPFYYHVVDDTTIVSSGPVEPLEASMHWLSLSTVASDARSFSSLAMLTYDPMSSTAYINHSNLRTLDGVLTSSTGSRFSGGGPGGHGQAFAFNLLNGIKGVPGYQGVTTVEGAEGVLSGLVLEWAGFATQDGQPLSFWVWNPVANQWEELRQARVELNSRLLITVPNSSDYVNGSGFIWLSVQTPYQTSTPTISTDLARIGITLTEEIALTATRNADVTASVTLTWRGVDSYHVYRSASSEGAATWLRLTDSPVAGGTYKDSLPPRGAELTYALLPAEAGVGSDQLILAAPLPASDAVTRRVEQEIPEFTYTGIWSHLSMTAASGGLYAASTSNPTNESVSYSFYGTGAAIIASKGPFGKADVYLDNVTAGTVDLYSSVQTNKVKVWEVKNLPLGLHTIKLQYQAPGASGYKKINIDAMDVTGFARAPINPQISREGSAVHLTWSPPESGLTYQVYRSTRGSALFEPIETPSGFELDDTPPDPETSRYLVVAIHPTLGPSAAIEAGGQLAGVGAYDASGAPWSFGGPWSIQPDLTAVGGSLRVATGPESYARFPVGGGEVRLIGTRGPDHGEMQVKHNGALLATIDLYQPAPQSGVELFRLDGVAPGSIFEFSPTGTKNPASTGTKVQLDLVQILPGGVPWFLSGSLQGADLNLKWVGTASATGYRVICTPACGADGLDVVTEVSSDTTQVTVTPPVGKKVIYQVRGIRADGSETGASNPVEVYLGGETSVGLDGRYPYVGVGLTSGTGYLHVPSGKLVLPLTDFVIPFNTTAIVLRRTYNSSDSYSHAMGRGWRLNFEQELTFAANQVTWTDGDGSQQRFALVDGSYQSEKATYDRLAQSTTGWVITRKDGVQHRFDDGGKLIAVTDKNGNGIQYVREEGGSRITALVPIWADPSATLFEPIVPAVNLQVTLGYDLDNRLVTATLPADETGDPRVYTYAYGSDGYLASVTDPAGYVSRFTYDQVGHLVGVSQGESLHTTVEYGAERVDAVIDGLGNAYSFDYDYDRVTIRSPLGHATTFVVNGEGRLTTVTLADESSTFYSYDAAGNLSGVTDALGRQTQVSAYDDWGNPLQVVDALGGTTTFQYDGPWHQVSQTTDALGRSQRFTYDTSGNLLQATVGLPAASDSSAAKAVLTKYAYDQFGRRTRSYHPVYADEEPRAGVSYAYTNEGWVASVSEPHDFNDENDQPAIQLTLAYNSVGSLIRSTDALQRSTQQVYDLAGRRTQLIAPNDGITRTAYDSAGLPVSVSDPMGGTTQQIFDAAGRIIAVTNALGQTTRTEYDADGQLVAVIDPLGNRQQSAYDTAGRLVAVTDALGNTTRTEYDAVGNAIAQTSPSGYVVHAIYDALNRQVQTEIGTVQTKITYDALGRQTLVKRSVRDDTAAIPQNTKYDYDTVGRLTKVWDAGQLDSNGEPLAESKPTTYEYDARGNRTRVIDANGNATETVYNLRNQPIREIDPEGGLVTYLYDVAGQLTDRVNGNADTQSYAYDKMGQLVALWYEEYAPPITYEYDLLGRLTAVRERTGVTEYEYDKLGRVTSYRDALGQRLQYEYDEAGRRTGLVLPEGSWRYGYDPAGRMISVSDPGGLTTTYQYNVDGQRTQTNLPYGITKINTFDPASQRLTKQEYKGTGALLTLTYGYDGFNNVNTVRRSAGSTSWVTTYTYDVLNRLIETNLDNPDTTPDQKSLFTYDPVGNRTKQEDWVGGRVSTTHTYLYDKANRILDEMHVKGTVTTYDRYLYDAAGRLLMVNSDAGTSKRYEYDGLDRLTKLVAGSAVTTYRYDAEGRRVSRKTVDRVGGTSDGVYYQYDGSQAIVERDGAGTARGLVTRGLGGELLTFEEPGKKAYVYLTDYLGSVLEMRDDQKKVVNSYAYDAFGNVTSATEGVRNDWKFTGANFDGATGLYHLGARYYAPADGRFITQDTYKGNPWEPWSQHLYVYVGNNPVNFIDPTGHCREPGDPSAWWNIGTWVECGSWVSNTAKGISDFVLNIFGGGNSKAAKDAANAGQAYRIKKDGIRIDDKQWGKKIGKHAEDWGLDASKAENRDWLRKKVVEIFKDAEEIREGTFSGQGADGVRGVVRFFRQGNDVVITKLDGTFVTVMKDGINNTSFINATIIP